MSTAGGRSLATTWSVRRFINAFGNLLIILATGKSLKILGKETEHATHIDFHVGEIHDNRCVHKAVSFDSIGEFRSFMLSDKS